MDRDNPYRINLPFRSDADEFDRLHERGHSLAVLRDAVERCQDEDMRTDEVLAALEYLRGCIKRVSCINSFRQSLDIQNPIQRYQAANFSLKAIVCKVQGNP